MILSKEHISAIEAAWEPDDGPLWKLRQGEVDVEKIDALLRLLDDIKITDDDVLPRRFVSLVWYLPIFFEWQRERVAAEGGDVRIFQTMSNRVVAVVQRLLGVP